MELSRYTNLHNSIKDLILMCTMGLMEDTNVHICFENVILLCTIEKHGFRGTHCTHFDTNVYNGSLLYTIVSLSRLVPGGRDETNVYNIIVAY